MNDMDDIYKNFEEYNPTKKRKIVVSIFMKIPNTRALKQISFNH